MIDLSGAKMNGGWVYDIPLVGLSIVAVKRGKTWEGLIYDQKVADKIALWGRNLKLPTWAGGLQAESAIRILASREDDEKKAKYEHPRNKTIITCSKKDGGWSGEIISPTNSKVRQTWNATAHPRNVVHMESGPWKTSKTMERALLLLSSAHPVSEAMAAPIPKEVARPWLRRAWQQ